MNKKLIICGILLPLLMASCHGNKTENDDATDSLANDTSLTELIDSIVISNNTDSCIVVDNNIQYLNAKGMPYDSINAGILQQIMSKRMSSVSMEFALQQLADSIFRDFSIEKKEDGVYSTEPIPAATYDWNLEGRFENQTCNDIITYKYELFTYMGGAHGSDEIVFLNFNTRTGHLMTPWDVLDKNKKKKVLDLMLTQLIKDNKCKTREELIDKTGILAMGDLTVTSNFIITDKGLTFHFGQYELACYAAGMQDIDLSWDVLEKAGVLIDK